MATITEELISLRKDQQQEFLKKLEDLNEQYLNAGVGTRGDIKNLITQTEKDIAENDKQINQLQAQVNSNEIQSLSIYVITGVDATVRRALQQDIFNALQPPNHDNVDCSKWRPFIDETFKISEIISELKDKGYKFRVFYLDGKQDEDL